MEVNSLHSWKLKWTIVNEAASIVKVAFGLDELSGTFSLRLQPYQISRLEQSYEAFCQSMA